MRISALMAKILLESCITRRCGSHARVDCQIMRSATLALHRYNASTEDSMQVLRAATSDAAETLGLLSSLGTLSPGKLADFVVYPPGIDLLGDDIRTSRQIRYVARGGRLWDASNMEEVWPAKGKKQVMPPLNAD